jgi:UPF0755 protein
MLNLLKSIFILFLLGLLSLGGIWMAYQHPIEWQGNQKNVLIPPKTSVMSMVKMLTEAGLPVDDPLSQLAWGIGAKLSGQGKKFKAGEYEIQNGMSLRQIQEKMARGEVIRHQFTLVEGWDWRRVRANLNQHPALRHDTATWNDQQIAQALGINAPHPEGWLFPDTYRFTRGLSDLELMKQAHLALRKRLEYAWEHRESNLPLQSMDEALILASIVEKETGRATDRPHIAAVFINRLKTNMPLQTDPTVIYGLGIHFDGNLRKHDLRTPTPYNTYLIKGLPPTPIAFAGLQSIEATLHPSQSGVLYFVARGDGSSQFSETLDEHNAAVNQYQRRKNKSL